MKAHELAALLMTQPNLEVCVDGYEGGISSVKPESVKTVGIYRDVYNRKGNRPWYYGEHEAVSAAVPSQVTPDTLTDLVWLIPRKNRDTE